MVMMKKYLIGICIKLIQIIVIFTLTVTWAWPLYGIGLLLWGRPPIIPRLEQILYYSHYCIFHHQTSTEDDDNEGKQEEEHQPFLRRVYIFLQIMLRVVCIPFGALPWYFDEILYGTKLNKINVEEPLFVMSAGRSGSTQVSLYLEDDLNLVAPNILQCMAPFLWLWKIVPATLGRFITKDYVREKIRTIMPPELLERHEGDLFQADTFDGPFYSWHLNYMSFSFDPTFAAQEFGFAKYYTPLRQKCWEEDFVTLVDRLARKTLLQYEQSHPNDASSPRFFLKGHFLAAGTPLAQKYPDAKFLTIVREPASRLQSGINFLRVNPPDPVLGPTPWEWLAKALEQTEIDYSYAEYKWFTQKEEEDSSNVKVCVLPFKVFCKDLKGSMEFVYKKLELSNSVVPSTIPTKHPPRDRKNYSINESLDDLGIDRDVLHKKLEFYLEWCEELEKAMQ